MTIQLECPHCTCVEHYDKKVILGEPTPISRVVRESAPEFSIVVVPCKCCGEAFKVRTQLNVHT